MANIGEKRPAPDNSPEEAGAKVEEETLPSAPKRPAPAFNFRPSPLQQATRGFSLKQSSLPSTSSTAPLEGQKGSESSAKSTVTPLQGGFLKLDSDDLKPVSVSLGAPSPSNAFRSGPIGSPGADSSRNQNQLNHASGSENNNLFLQFVAPTSSANSFSSSSPNSISMMSTHHDEATPTNTGDDGSQRDEGAAVQGEQLLNSNGEDFSGGSVETRNMPFGFQGATAILPEVHTVTGEENEKKIVQIPARLYAFDVTTHTWKERGRGEVRLNDAAQSEGLFQSRLVMRTTGSYRILLNTHLWAQMKCERANQKSIRITAQHEDQVAVFLIMGATKDIQQLFTAVDRRIEALKRNQNTADAERDAPNSEKGLAAEVPFDDDDKESFLDEPHSSPDSSPECHVGSRTRLAHTTVKTVGMPSSSKRKEEGRVGRSDGRTRGAEVPRGREEAGEEAGCGSDTREGLTSDKESTTATPPSSRSPSLGASTTTISSSDNAPEPNLM